jgi:hypothetical protein
MVSRSWTKTWVGAGGRALTPEALLTVTDIHSVVPKVFPDRLAMDF